MSQNLKNVTLVGFLVLVFSLQTWGEKKSCAELLSVSWLEEKTSPPVVDWVRDQNRQTNEYLETSNLKRASALVLAKIHREELINSISVGSLGDLLLYDYGLQNPKELILQEPSGKKVSLLKSTDWKKNGTFNFVGLQVSANQRYVSLMVAENGTIDDFKLILYDLNLRKVISDELVSVHKPEIYWLSGDRFLIQTKDGLADYAIQNEGLKLLARVGDKSVLSTGGVTVVSGHGLNVVYQNGQKPFMTEGFSVKEVLGALDGKVYLQITGENANGEIWEVTPPAEASGKPTYRKLIPESSWSIGSPRLSGSKIVLENTLGYDQRLVIYSLVTGTMETIPLPDCCALNSANLRESDNVLELSFSSPVTESKTFLYSLNSKMFVSATPNSATMMTVDGIEYQQTKIGIPSKDGTVIPTRIVHRKDMPLNGSSAAVVSAYGGFGLQGYLEPRFNPMEAEFLKRGGVIVGTGLRGGSEFGKNWRKEGSRSKKQNVLDDLNATVEHLQKLGYMAPEKTVVTGWSNGGMVTAAAALQRPELYGLVIPGNGVQDYLNANRLDPRFDGWNYEYGNVNSKDIEFMRLVSPIELAKKRQRVPRFLIMTGLDDSRVNASHAFKLTEVLKQNVLNPEDVHLMTIRNAGHWMTSKRYQDVIALRSTAVIWATVFKLAGMRP